MLELEDPTTKGQRELRRELGAKVLCVALGVFLLTFLVSYAILGKTRLDFALRSVAAYVVPSEGISLSVLGADQGACADYHDCLQGLLADGEPTAVGTKTAMRLQALIEEGAATVIVRYKLAFDRPLERGDGAEVIALPELEYTAAHWFVAGHHERSFYEGERLFITLADRRERTKEITFDVLFVNPSADLVDELTEPQGPYIIAPRAVFDGYLKYLGETSIGQGEQVGMIARVVLSLLMLVFFVAINSSPAVLGLALTMGFEATGMCLGNVDLRHQWLVPGPHLMMVKLLLYTVSDAMKLYFMLHLAGRSRTPLAPLLAIGTVYGAIYGATIGYGSELGVPSIYFWFPRMMLTSTLGVGYCVAALWRGSESFGRWRKLALIFTVAGVSVDIFDALTGLSDDLVASMSYSVFMSIAKSLKAYVLALGAFFAIADLRNQLRALTAERERARELAREMQLGRKVQQSFLEVPALPQGLAVAVSHEAAAYVSGDTYFIDWNPNLRLLTVLLNDVPGHGLQAALKAFACGVIAKAVWGHSQQLSDRRRFRSRFPVYRAQVDEFLAHEVDQKPFNAFVGVELFVDRRLAIFYRSNYNFPIVIDPEPVSGGWRVRPVVAASDHGVEVELGPGTFLVLASDGLVPTSKVQARFIEHLSRTLVRGEAASDAAAVLAAAMACKEVRDNGVHDDRSLVVVHWLDEVAEMPLRLDAQRR